MSTSNVRILVVDDEPSIRRFLRPVAYQNVPAALLPPAHEPRLSSR